MKVKQWHKNVRSNRKGGQGTDVSPDVDRNDQGQAQKNRTCSVDLKERVQQKLEISEMRWVIWLLIYEGVSVTESSWFGVRTPRPVRSLTEKVDAGGQKAGVHSEQRYRTVQRAG